RFGRGSKISIGRRTAEVPRSVLCRFARPPEVWPRSETVMLGNPAGAACDVPSPKQDLYVPFRSRAFLDAAVSWTCHSLLSHRLASAPPSHGKSQISLKNHPPVPLLTFFPPRSPPSLAANSVIRHRQVASGRSADPASKTRNRPAGGGACAGPPLRKSSP